MNSVAQTDTLPALPGDSVQSDTIAKKDSGLEFPVEYGSADSMTFSMDYKKAFLWGNAFLKTDEIDLKAAYIEVNFNDETVYASGMKDTAGVEYGKPVYTEGSETLTATEMKYNYRTRRGVVKGVRTEQADGYLLAEQTKMHENNEVHIQTGKYTTCDAEHPHYYINLTKAKKTANDKIISGPMYFVIEDIPLFPIGLPFGYFPSQKKRQSGILMPGYGEDGIRGFYFKNVGYYFAFSDYWDLGVSGDIYTYGSYGVRVTSRYKARYKFGGSFSANYNQNVTGEKGLPDYTERKDFKIRWNHSQDPKSNPTTSFTANVDFGTSSYNRYNEDNIGDFLKNTKSSSINYTKRWPGSPFTFSANIKGSQNTSTSAVDLSLPLMTFSMARQYPFKKLAKVQTGKWYEKIGVSYSANFSNAINTIDTLLFTPDTRYRFRNGFKHSIPINTSFKLLKHFNVSPSFNYNARVYTNSIRKEFQEDLFFDPIDSVYTYGALVTDTLSGVRHVFDYQFSVPVTTKLYGMFYFDRIKKIEAVRHVVTPSLGYSYRPDFSEERFGFYDTYYRNAEDSVGALYSYFDNGIYGTAPKGKSGSINFSLNNNLEMKVKAKNDTTDENFKKIMILERLSISGNYNLAIDSLNLSPISVSGGTRLFNAITLNFSGTFDPYATDTLGRTKNAYEWTENGRFARFTRGNISAGINLNSTNLGKDKKADREANSYYDQGYVDFSLPWSLRADYVLSVSKTKFNAEEQIFEPTFTQTLRYSGNLSLTEKWKVNFSSGYDLIAQKATTTSIGVTRDLHCWQMSFRWVPFGQRQSYFFRINLKSSIFEGLEFKREDSWYDNL